MPLRLEDDWVSQMPPELQAQLRSLSAGDANDINLDWGNITPNGIGKMSDPFGAMFSDILDNPFAVLMPQEDWRTHTMRPFGALQDYVQAQITDAVKDVVSDFTGDLGMGIDLNNMVSNVDLSGIAGDAMGGLTNLAEQTLSQAGAFANEFANAAWQGFNGLLEGTIGKGLDYLAEQQGGWFDDSLFSEAMQGDMASGTSAAGSDVANMTSATQNQDTSVLGNVSPDEQALNSMQDVNLGNMTSAGIDTSLEATGDVGVGLGAEGVADATADLAAADSGGALVGSAAEAVEGATVLEEVAAAAVLL